MRLWTLFIVTTALFSPWISWSSYVLKSKGSTLSCSLPMNYLNRNVWETIVLMFCTMFCRKKHCKNQEKCYVLHMKKKTYKGYQDICFYHIGFILAKLWPIPKEKTRSLECWLKLMSKCLCSKRSMKMREKIRIGRYMCPNDISIEAFNMVVHQPNTLIAILRTTGNMK